MKAIGMITGKKSAAVGFPLVNLYRYDKDLGMGTLVNYCLANEDKVPVGHPNFGLFEFEPADQFCRWIDPNKS